MTYSFAIPDLPTILAAVGLTVIAGAATGLGAVVTMFARRTNTRMLTFAMGLSAGVMIYISFMELLPDARHGFGSVC